MENEIWKEINGYEGLYKISTYGNVYSYRLKRNIALRAKENKYLIVTLYKNGIGKNYYIHRLVALAFIKNDDPINKTIINHKNEIKNDNRVENLEWCDYKYNALYGTSPKRLSEKTKNYMKNLSKELKEERVSKQREKFISYVNSLTPEERKNKFGHEITEKGKIAASNQIKEFNHLKFVLSYLLFHQNEQFIIPTNLNDSNIKKIYDDELNENFILNKNSFMIQKLNIHNQKCYRYTKID
jgi:hypothetical protein